MTRRGLLGRLVAGTVLAALSASAGTFYVDVNYSQSNGASDGTSTRPYTNITAAAAAANANGTERDTIYIADGTYKSTLAGGYEDFTSNTGILFTSYADLYGGYAGVVGAAWDNTRVPRSTVIDLTGANSRAFVGNGPTGGGTGILYDGLTLINANHTFNGGAIFTVSGYDLSTMINNCLFSNNVTTGSGGGANVEIKRFGAIKGYIHNSDFINNHANTNGGGLYLDEPYLGENPIFTNCNFRGNSCGERGGAIFATGGDIRFKNHRFESNTAGIDGGAVFHGGDGRNGGFVLECCVLASNAAVRGSAVGGSDYHSGAYTLINCLVYSNSGGFAVYADPYGWEIADTDYVIDMSYCTVVDNTNGGVYARNFNGMGLRIRDSIISDNGATGIHWSVGSAGTGTVAFSDVYGHTTNYAGQATAGVSCISLRPRFLDAAQRDYRLSGSSPCIDAATNLSVFVDLQGTNRPLRDGYDMGCYEMPPTPEGTIIMIR